MKNIFYTIVVILFITSCKNEEKQPQKRLQPDWKTAQTYYLTHIENTIKTLDSLEKTGISSNNAKTVFSKLREEFKKAEPYASYLNPEVGHRVNGPALPVFKDDNQKILHPVGLQKLEESIYEGEVANEEFLYEIKITRGMLNVLKNDIIKRELNAERFFVSVHQQLLRIVSFSISGFDTPVSHLGINEAAISLKSLLQVYNLSIAAIIKSTNTALDIDFNKKIESAVSFVEKNKDYEDFDRYTFIREYVNPIMATWINIRKESNLWEGSDKFPFNFDAPTFFENDSFNPNYFIPAINRNPSKKQIALGEKLFFEPGLSQNGKMACATCHIPEKAYADGLKVNNDNQDNPLKRNTPTLLNVVYQQSFFLDGRSETILDQVSSVFTNKDEFNSAVHKFSDKILNDTTYIYLFEEAYGKVPTRNTEVIKAISSYISTLNSFNSRFDKNMRGEENTFTDQEKLGFNLFMGKALCATCHFLPLTNGTVPPFYKETEKEVIGVPGTADNKELDDDLGFYWKYEEELHKGMFKTPTIRNAQLTAPYMHNGVYSTLEEVINFYNLGGGGGLGFDLEYQTLPFDNLELTEDEQNAIVAFIKTLSDDRVAGY
ncbi:cytochrome-c peroxidase [Abyssalbus ytuae]|uniref:Cytochrome-c peroxidase n=1 Tax=Abyssalbus ytuae TaxID=2926907 RepID=A0A9E6ZKI1_9FLAO|nr:cytochrome c peroxidase [Abyssalbus ytuae]UOB17384.1 cytochrome-c peroxidase [Abyssalbus ytuae]